MTPKIQDLSNLKARPGLAPAKPKGTAITKTCCRQKRKIHYITTKPLCKTVNTTTDNLPPDTFHATDNHQ